MDTHAQFRRSETQMFPVRLAVFAAALGAGLLAGAGAVLPAAVIGLGFAGYASATHFALAARFRSDAWIYGMLAADLVFAGAAMFAVGAMGPAVAIPAFMVAQYALFLGYRGAGAAAAGGVAATAAGAMAAGTGVLEAAGTSMVVCAGVAAAAGYLAERRFAERASAATARNVTLMDAEASRLLDALGPIADAPDETSALQALADALPSLSGLPAAAVYARDNANRLTLRAVCLEGNEQEPPADDIDPEGRSVVAVAQRQGIAIAIGEGGQSRSGLPEWAVRLGYDCGFAAPLANAAGGVALGLGRPGSAVSLSRLQRLERFLGLASHLTGTRRAVRAPARGRLAHELESAGRAASGPTRRPIATGTLTLDPETDRSSLGEVAVALSRTEFDLLYALADRAGDVVDPESLVVSAWGEGDGAEDRAVDGVIYRLRRKLGRAPGGGNLIQTVRGRGYTLVPPGEDVLDGVTAAAD